ncbi:unnamed protein product [Somion occarium]|uniref:Uncharacterized protein n=1 Tax=Somion occarium TaxID=3059160 RepID=A0ABP1DYF8_9APHY
MTDIAFDTTWCPVCSRQILPKRIQIPLAPPPPPATPAPPPSPTQTKPDAPRMQRSKTGTIRARQGGGLVHGTGRVKPNGALKRSDPTRDQQAALLSSKKSVVAPEPTRPTVARSRTVIDQGPIPLYCSDECRIADLQSSFASTGIDYHPDRHSSPPLPPVPHNSFDDVSSQSDSDSSSDSVSAIGSSSIFTTLPPAPHASNPGPAGSNAKQNQAEAGRLASARAYAALQSIYDIPPCPAAPPLSRTDTSSSASSDDVPNDYQSGVMMAAKRIGEALCRPAEPKKRPSWATPSAMLSTAYALDAHSKDRKVIPGWTDGSNAWRASVYSFAPPPKDGKLNPYMADDDPSLKAYRGHVATPLRSKSGVYSTVTDTAIGASSSSSVASTTTTPARSQSDVDQLYSKFSASLTRRCESRQSLHRPALSTSPANSTRSLPTTIASSAVKHREVPLVAPGAEGKLLVPNVKMRRISSSGSDAGSFVRRRSPLSRQGSEMSVIEDEHEDDVTVGLQMSRLTDSPKVKKPVEARSWSYSDIVTYPIMQLPPQMEKRVERRIVNGVEQDVEVEVEIIPERKRLFLFADEPGPIRSRRR